MRYEDWNNGLNQIDMSFIEEYIDEKRKYKKKRSIRSLAVRMSAAVACAALIFTAIIVPIKMIDHSGPDDETTTQNTEPNPNNPIYKDVSYTAEDIARVMRSIATYGSTNAYREVYVSDPEYLYITPIPENKTTAYIYEFQKVEKPHITKEEFGNIASDVFTAISNNFGNGTTSFEYEIKYSEKYENYDTETVIAGIDASISHGESVFVALRPEHRDVGMCIKGNKIQINQNLSDEEIIESLEPVKELLFKTFGVDFSEAEVIRSFLEYEDGAVGIRVRFYDMSEYMKPLGVIRSYIDIEFSKKIADIEDKDIFEIRTIYYRKDRASDEEYYKIKSEVDLISMQEAEKLLYKGYVFGGHSCRLCMAAQDKISFRGYDYVEIEYIFDREYSGISSVQTVGIPFYAFYKEIGTAKNGNLIYAKTYVPAIEVSGLEEYFEEQITNHK